MEWKREVFKVIYFIRGGVTLERLRGEGGGGFAFFGYRGGLGRVLGEEG